MLSEVWPFLAVAGGVGVVLLGALLWVGARMARIDAEDGVDG